MAMNHMAKTRPADAADAIQRFLEDGGRVKIRGVDRKSVKAHTWQGSKITCGFNMKDLRDGK